MVHGTLLLEVHMLYICCASVFVHTPSRGQESGVLDMHLHTASMLLDTTYEPVVECVPCQLMCHNVVLRHQHYPYPQVAVTEFLLSLNPFLYA
jgi:hypothetical protein